MLNLDNNRDFPYYNENPKMSKIGWLVLLICIPVAYYANGFVSVFSNEIIGSISFLLILLIPLLYFSNWDYSLFFQKPTKNEFILAVLMCLAYIVYSSILTNLLGTWGIPDVGNSNANIVTIVSLIFSMMAEELIKFIPLMFLLRVLFLSVLVIQGAGSIFHLYVYLKTKNLFASYLSHLMTDASVLILVMMGLIG